MESNDYTIKQEIKDFLEYKYLQYNKPEFIEGDPVSIPHLFTKKQDIEIAGFLAATISWGQRKTIIVNATKLMEIMEFEPYDFIMNASNPELLRFSTYKHRTFQWEDTISFIKSLQNIYRDHGSLEAAFRGESVKDRIINFRKKFFELPHPSRTEKHVANPAAGASAKRINMFLRWMVRKDEAGIDFGIWKSIKTSELYCPLDVHSGNTARKLGLLCRKQNDWKAVEELTENLRKLDSEDPVKFDIALFGLGALENF